MTATTANPFTVAARAADNSVHRFTGTAARLLYVYRTATVRVPCRPGAPALRTVLLTRAADAPVAQHCPACFPTIPTGGQL